MVTYLSQSVVFKKKNEDEINQCTQYLICLHFTPLPSFNSLFTVHSQLIVQIVIYFLRCESRTGVCSPYV